MKTLANLFKNSDSSFSLKGRLGFSSIKQIASAAKSLLNFKSDITIDCAMLEHCDSAGIALLVNWQKAAKLNGVKILFVNFTQQMQHLIALMGLESVFFGDKKHEE